MDVSMMMIDETAAKLNTHEAVCAERYKQILDKFDNGSGKMESMENKIEGLETKVTAIKDDVSKIGTKISTIGALVAGSIVLVQVVVEIWRAFHG
jgi:archaellum component FlaC